MITLDTNKENSNKEKRIVTDNTINAAIAFFSLLASFRLVYSIDSSGYYLYLFLLPLGHSFLMLFFINTIKTSTYLTHLIIVSGYFIKNVLAPFCLSFSNYSIENINAILPKDQISVIKSVLLLLYETSIVFAFLVYYTNKEEKKNERLACNKDIIEQKGISNPNNLQTNNDNNLIHQMTRRRYGIPYCIIITTLSILLLYEFIIIPEISNSYKSIWDSDNSILATRFSEIDNFQQKSTGRFYFAFFAYFLPIIQFIISFHLINIFFRVFSSELIAVLFSFTIILFNTTLVSESSATPIYICTILFFFLYNKIHSKHAKTTAKYLVSLGFISIFTAIFSFKFGNDSTSTNIMSDINFFINGYFPGLTNTTGLWITKTPNKYLVLYKDIISSMPLQGFFPINLNVKRLVEYYCDSSFVNFQIIPFSSQMYYYFGAFGVIIQLVFVFLAIKSEILMRKTKDEMKYLILLICVFYFSITNCCYNLQWGISFLFFKLIPLLLFYKLSFISSEYKTYFKAQQT